MFLPNIGFITDFGDQDGFSGVMKGVILSNFDSVRLVDIAHHIPAQDVRHASWVLEQVFDHFPGNTVFLCVVDPFVGNPGQKKLAINVESVRKVLVLPDNGLATRVLKRYPEHRIVSLDDSRFFRTDGRPSSTFHGRDIYAPCAAHLAKGFYHEDFDAVFSSLGAVVETHEVQTLAFAKAFQDDGNRILGEVDVIDQYGNVITNIPSGWLKEPDVEVTLGFTGRQLPSRFVSSYSAVRSEEAESTLIVVAGSHGMLEIALQNGRAEQYMGVQATDQILVSVN